MEKSITTEPQRVRGTTSYWSQWTCEVSFHLCIKNNGGWKAHHVWKAGRQKWTNFLGLRDVCRDVIELTPQPCLQKGFHIGFSERGIVVITAKPCCGSSGYEVLVTAPLLLLLLFVLLFGLKRPNVLWHKRLWKTIQCQGKRSERSVKGVEDIFCMGLCVKAWSPNVAATFLHQGQFFSRWK